MPRSDDPFEVLERIGPNAYKVDLPGDYGVSATFNVADLSPYYEEEEELPSLRSNSNQIGEYDGDHLHHPSNSPPSIPQGARNTKEAKEVQAMVRNFMSNDLHQLSSSNSFWPGFVSLTECNSEGQISCTHDPIQASELIFPTRTYEGNLELIWLVNRGQNRSIYAAGLIPAKAECVTRLDDLLNSVFCQTLGHENAS